MGGDRCGCGAYTSVRVTYRHDTPFGGRWKCAGVYGDGSSFFFSSSLACRLLSVNKRVLGGRTHRTDFPAFAIAHRQLLQYVGHSSPSQQHTITEGYFLPWATPATRGRARENGHLGAPYTHMCRGARRFRLLPDAGMGQVAALGKFPTAVSCSTSVAPTMGSGTRTVAHTAWPLTLTCAPLALAPDGHINALTAADVAMIIVSDSITPADDGWTKGETWVTRFVSVLFFSMFLSSLTVVPMAPYLVRA